MPRVYLYLQNLSDCLLRDPALSPNPIDFLFRDPFNTPNLKDFLYHYSVLSLNPIDF